MSEETGAIEVAACYWLSQEYLMTRFSGEIFDGEDMVSAFVAGSQFSAGEENRSKRTGNVIFLDKHRKGSNGPGTANRNGL